MTTQPGKVTAQKPRSKFALPLLIVIGLLSVFFVLNGFNVYFRGEKLTVSLTYFALGVLGMIFSVVIAKRFKRFKQVNIEKGKVTAQKPTSRFALRIVVLLIVGPLSVFFLVNGFEFYFRGDTTVSLTYFALGAVGLIFSIVIAKRLRGKQPLGARPKTAVLGAVLSIFGGVVLTIRVLVLEVRVPSPLEAEYFFALGVLIIAGGVFIFRRRYRLGGTIALVFAGLSLASLDLEVIFGISIVGIFPYILSMLGGILGLTSKEKINRKPEDEFTLQEPITQI